MGNQHANEETQGHLTACYQQESNVMLRLNNINMHMTTLLKTKQKTGILQKQMLKSYHKLETRFPCSDMPSLHPSDVPKWNTGLRNDKQTCSSCSHGHSAVVLVPEFVLFASFTHFAV